jgi:TetR/AcrR family transcriptional regulator, transcriptional repressor for nem operon
MNRPSQRIDLQLIESGMALLPDTGCTGLSVRRLVEHANVNLGMFHYHFKNKDNFIREVLQRFYEEMFSALNMEIDQTHGPVDSLRAALTVLCAFGTRHRKLLSTLLAESMQGEALVSAFLRENLPRHIAIIARLLMEGQAAGVFVQAPLPHLLPFLLGGVGMPPILGGAIERMGAAPRGMVEHMLSPAALELRINLALRAIVIVNPEGMPQ